MIFKGHLTSMFPEGAFGCYLNRPGVLLKDVGKSFERQTEAIKQYAKSVAEQARRPFVYLESALIRVRRRRLALRSHCASS